MTFPEASRPAVELAQFPDQIGTYSRILHGKVVREGQRGMPVQAERPVARPLNSRISSSMRTACCAPALDSTPDQDVIQNHRTNARTCVLSGFGTW